MSIESSPRWRSQLRNRYPVLEQAEANASARLQLESASLEPTGLWGIPMGWTTRPRSLRRQQVLNNSAIPTSLAHSVPSGLALAAALATPFDVIFADGRFRIFCLVRALCALRMLVPYLPRARQPPPLQQQPRAVVRDDAAGRQTCAASAAPRCVQGCPPQLDGLPRRLAAAPAECHTWCHRLADLVLTRDAR